MLRKKSIILCIILVCFFVLQLVAYASTQWDYPGMPTIQPRENWNAVDPISEELVVRGTASCVIFHHTGNNGTVAAPFTSTDYTACANKIWDIQEYHMNTRGWEDIGYHYIVDPAGRVWEGRQIIYEGAHTYGYNNNVGIIVLGDYEGIGTYGTGAQTLTSASYNGMLSIAKYRIFVESYDLPGVYGHQDFNSTSCPGRNLQPTVVGQLRQDISNQMVQSN